jgi:hypothetical protein
MGCDQCVFWGQIFTLWQQQKFDFFLLGFLSVNFLRKKLLKWKKFPNFQSHKIEGEKNHLAMTHQNLEFLIDI